MPTPSHNGRRDTPLVVGLDVGTSNIKAIIVDAGTTAIDGQGAIIAQASHPTATVHGPSNWVGYDHNALWQQIETTLRDVAVMITAPERIVGISVASIAETGFALDADGACVAQPIAWFDKRTAPQAERAIQQVGVRRLSTISGLAMQPIYSLFKILWLRDNDPQAFRRMRLWLNTADWVAWRLSGIAATDYSLASRTMLFDVRKRQWSLELLEAFDLDPTLLAPLKPSGTPLAPLKPEVAQRIGFPPQTIVAVGGHDHICGALALGVDQAGTILDSLGTSEALYLPIDAPVIDDQLVAQGYTCGCNLLQGYYLLGGIWTSGGAVNWFRRECAPDISYDRLIAEAGAAPPGSGGLLFLPHLIMADPPIVDAASRGAFVGLRRHTTRGDMFRALLEGLAYEARYGFEPILRHTGFERPRRFIVTGGNIHNRLLMQIKATLFDRPCEIVNTAQTAALGAAILAGLGAALFPDVTVAPPPSGTSERNDSAALRPCCLLRSNLPRNLFRSLYHPA